MRSSSRASWLAVSIVSSAARPWLGSRSSRWAATPACTLIVVSVCGDDVVQVTGDPQPLLLGPSLRLLLAASLGQLDPLEQNPNVGAAVAERFRGQYRDGDQGDVGGGL